MAFSCPDADIIPESLSHCRNDSCSHIHDHSHADHNPHSHSGNGTCSHNHTDCTTNDTETADTQDIHGNAPSSLAKEIHEYLNAHLDQHITIESLSRHFCVNPTTIKTVFREEFGNSIAAHKGAPHGKSRRPPSSHRRSHCRNRIRSRIQESKQVHASL